MNIDEARAAVEVVRAMSGDPEAAHSEEGELYLTFIRHVATRQDKLGAVARIILETRDMQFERWRA